MKHQLTIEGLRVFIKDRHVIRVYMGLLVFGLGGLLFYLRITGISEGRGKRNKTLAGTFLTL